jgi:hypothetical protein
MASPGNLSGRATLATIGVSDHTAMPSMIRNEPSRPFQYCNR